MKRRKFLKSAAAIAGATIITPAILISKPIPEVDIDIKQYQTSFKILKLGKLSWDGANLNIEGNLIF